MLHRARGDSAGLAAAPADQEGRGRGLASEARERSNTMLEPPCAVHMNLKTGIALRGVGYALEAVSGNGPEAGSKSGPLQQFMARERPRIAELLRGLSRASPTGGPVAPNLSYLDISPARDLANIHRLMSEKRSSLAMTLANVPCAVMDRLTAVLSVDTAAAVDGRNSSRNSSRPSGDVLYGRPVDIDTVSEGDEEDRSVAGGPLGETGAGGDILSRSGSPPPLARSILGFTAKLEKLMNAIVRSVRQLHACADQSQRSEYMTITEQVQKCVVSVEQLLGTLDLNAVEDASRARLQDSRKQLAGSMASLMQLAKQAGTVGDASTVKDIEMIDAAFDVAKALRDVMACIDALEQASGEASAVAMGAPGRGAGRHSSRAGMEMQISMQRRSSLVHSTSSLSPTKGMSISAGSGSQTALAAMHASADTGSVGSGGVAPPTGVVTLVFTDISHSTQLWEMHSMAMLDAVKAHNELMRQAIAECNGYEVKTEGDSFMIAFQGACDAMRFCLLVQDRMLQIKWPTEIVGTSMCQTIMDNTGQVLFHGLRVCMGIHTGEPDCELDPITKRMDYYGPMVNRASRVKAMADGGQIVMTSRTREAFFAGTERLPTFNLQLVDLGEFALKGVEQKERLFQLNSAALSRRQFSLLPTIMRDAHVSYGQLSEAGQTPDVPPPSDRLAIVYADIANAADLWRECPNDMQVAVRVHREYLRRSMHAGQGYEVKIEGDAVMVAFQRLTDAVTWCLTAQLQLMDLSWPPHILELRYCCEKRSADGSLLQRGFRVLMGVHWGKPEHELDPVTGRMDYFGPMVNRACRVSELVDGGQVVLSRAAYEEMRTQAMPDALQALRPQLKELGEHRLACLQSTEFLYQVLPQALQERVFRKIPRASGSFWSSVRIKKSLNLLMGELGTIRGLGCATAGAAAAVAVRGRRDSPACVRAAVRDAARRSFRRSRTSRRSLRRRWPMSRRSTRRRCAPRCPARISRCWARRPAIRRAAPSSGTLLYR